MLFGGQPSLYQSKIYLQELYISLVQLSLVIKVYSNALSSIVKLGHLLKKSLSVQVFSSIYTQTSLIWAPWDQPLSISQICPYLRTSSHKQYIILTSVEFFIPIHLCMQTKPIMSEYEHVNHFHIHNHDAHTSVRCKEWLFDDSCLLCTLYALFDDSYLQSTVYALHFLVLDPLVL